MGAELWVESVAWGPGGPGGPGGSGEQEVKAGEPCAKVLRPACAWHERSVGRGPGGGEDLGFTLSEAGPQGRGQRGGGGPGPRGCGWGGEAGAGPQEGSALSAHRMPLSAPWG